MAGESGVAVAGVPEYPALVILCDLTDTTAAQALLPSPS